MILLLIVMLIGINSAYAATPYHCSPWPADGTKYNSGTVYDVPIPHPCYSLMKPDGTIIDLAIAKFENGKIVEDPVLVGNRATAKALAQQQRETGAQNMRNIKAKAALGNATDAEIQEALDFIINKLVQ